MYASTDFFHIWKSMYFCLYYGFLLSVAESMGPGTVSIALKAQ